MADYQYGVIVTAHGHFAEGISSAIRLIVGPMENLKIINFEEGTTPEQLDTELKSAYDSFDQAKGVFVIADLKGGTPFNRSVMTLSEKNNVRILSGLNFASLYQALISEGDDMDALSEEIVQVGLEGITVYGETRAHEDVLDEDGI